MTKVGIFDSSYSKQGTGGIVTHIIKYLIPLLEHHSVQVSYYCYGGEFGSLLVQDIIKSKFPEVTINNYKKDPDEFIKNYSEEDTIIIEDDIFTYKADSNTEMFKLTNNIKVPLVAIMHTDPSNFSNFKRLDHNYTVLSHKQLSNLIFFRPNYKKSFREKYLPKHPEVVLNPKIRDYDKLSIHNPYVGYITPEEPTKDKPYNIGYMGRIASNKGFIDYLKSLKRETLNRVNKAYFITTIQQAGTFSKLSYDTFMKESSLADFKNKLVIVDKFNTDDVSHLLSNIGYLFVPTRSRSNISYPLEWVHQEAMICGTIPVIPNLEEPVGSDILKKYTYKVGYSKRYIPIDNILDNNHKDFYKDSKGLQTFAENNLTDIDKASNILFKQLGLDS